MDNKLTEEIKEVVEDEICYFATASGDGKPNVVPVGLVKAISDSEIAIVDLHFNKTGRNLSENKEVALAVTDIKRSLGYQLKGKAKILTDNEGLGLGFQILREYADHQEKRLEEIKDPAVKERTQKRIEIHRNLKPKSVVVINVEEVYSTMKR